MFFEFVKRVGKRNKMRSLSSILSLFRNEFDKFNNTGAWILDYIYHMTINYFEIVFVWRINVKILLLCLQHCDGRHYITLLNI